AAGLLFYLFLSGADVATQRAFLMTSLMFAAFIFGRNVFTMRNAGLVFAALLMLCPHYLLEPGFQMSFAAIFGMIWFFGKSEFKKTGWLKKIWRAIIIMIQTTIVCTIFTAPFVAYNFHSLPLYSLLGNLICLPIFSLLIMPLVMLCLTGCAASVYDWTLGIANWIAELPFAQIQIPTVPGIALIIAVCGLLILMFIQNKKNKYLAFAVCFMTFTLITAMNPKPIFYATGDHELVAFMRDDGKLQFNRSKSSAHYFTFSAWQQSNYETITDQHTTIRKGFDGERYSVKCERALCIYTTPEWSLAYTQKFMPLYRNMNSLCNNNDFLVSYLQIDAPDCKARTLQGGFVIYKSGRIKFTPNNRQWHKPIKKISE
ncbi:MAG: ComEC/Rec2 family competence protein, partial [Rickettsiales bacterium]|nr:ComEC/Rec2 family competence protein [Rickettsiales bacterium]